MQKIKKALLLVGALILWSPQIGYVQSEKQTAETGVYVDDKGVMRWEDGDEEIKGFGINYTTPFAHAYRSAKKLGVDPLAAIDQDVYHFARLGFDLYRVHVWDTEISDTLGNLLFNERLHAFDYLLKKLDERNINYVLTPIAYWGGGWPEPDQSTPGFSAKYGKSDCLTNPDAIKAQENYLYQFLNHVNPYTGIAYKNDPRLIAVEISNEPHHREEPEKVTAFIQRMVSSMRKTGYKKPIFYNISHSVHLVDDYFAADIQGGTFQWYPTGLGYQRELQGNFLPNVDDYHIPFDQKIRKHKGAKLVYEFDAADVGKSYIYPAMARSFREAGIQIATHFSYDPLFLAYANTEYNTHYMNLAYTPQKALSLKICSEIFHRVPMYKDYGSYPDNASFDGFAVSYEQDLAILNIADRFFYTNNTEVEPVNEAALNHIAGYGRSSLVDYDGTGAYFLDKLESGVWRLEVMPDALIIDNPYGRNSLDKTVAVIQWNERKMSVNIRDLGSDFTLKPLNQGNDYQPKVAGRQLSIAPGSYLLIRRGKDTKWKAKDSWQNIRLNEYHAPEPSVRQTHVIHETAETAIEGEPFTIEAEVISPDTTINVQILISGGFRGRTLDMEKRKGFTYEAKLPAERIDQGFLNYYIIVSGKDWVETYPSAKKGLPFQWDFYDRNPYQVRVIGKNQPIYLFNAQEDWIYLSRRWWTNTLRLVPTDNANESEYQVNLEKLFQPDNENLHAPIIPDYTLRHYVNKKIDHLRERLSGKKKLILKARSLNNKSELIQVALITDDGASYGVVIKISPDMEEYEIPLEDLKKANTVTMPRPYPTFLPYYFSNEKNSAFDVKTIEGIQFSIGPGIPEKSRDEKHGVAIVSLRLQ